jgi:hypothetical protein
MKQVPFQAPINIRCHCKKKLVTQVIWHCGSLWFWLIIFTEFPPGDAEGPMGMNQRVPRLYFTQHKILASASPVFDKTYYSFRYLLSPLYNVSFVRKCSTNRIREAPVVTKNGNISFRYISRTYSFI